MATIEFERLIKQSSLDEIAKNQILEENNSKPTFADEDEKSLELARIILNSPYDSKNRSTAIQQIMYRDNSYIERLKNSLLTVQAIINIPNIRHLGFHDQFNCDAVLRIACLLSEDQVKDQLEKIKTNMLLTSLLIEYRIVCPTPNECPEIIRRGVVVLGTVYLAYYLSDSEKVNEDFTKLISQQEDIGAFLDKCLETKNSTAIKWLIDNINLDEESKHFLRIINLESILNKDGAELEKLAFKAILEDILSQEKYITPESLHEIVSTSVEDIHVTSANQPNKRCCTLV